MSRSRIRGKLDPLFELTKTGTVGELAEVLRVTRQTVNKWQKGKPVSRYHQMNINLLMIGLGRDPLFPNTDKQVRDRQ